MDIFIFVKIIWLCACIFAVSAFSVFGTTWDVVANPTDEDVQFMAAVNFLFEMITRMAVELPLYKVYNNKLSRDSKAAIDVSNKTFHEILFLDIWYGLLGLSAVRI